MKAFDILDVEAPLFGKKLLEASAGTGKTFAIEHLFTRLLLEGEKPLEIGQILAITFTRAAARDLHLRIQENLKKALVYLREDKMIWPWLVRHRGSLDAEKKLGNALIAFDQAQIFTIHGFCQRMLSEFPLEASTSLADTQGESAFRKTLLPILLDFLEHQEILCPEQLGLLGDVEKLGADLLETSSLGIESAGDFKKDAASFRAVLEKQPVGSLRSEFEKLFSNFKISGFKVHELEEQVDALEKLFADPNDEKALGQLIYFGGSLFEFLAPENLKKGKEGSSELLNSCRKSFDPLIKIASDPKILLQRLKSAWQEIFEKLMEERSLFSPDFLLQKMQRALTFPEFLKVVREKYQAAIIDEFQDTDAIQWEIFRTVFLESPDKKPLYLVGDPKQSIYRFRKADLYTYFEARDVLGSESHYSLATNFRSTPALISALNDLFSDEWGESWLYLPRAERRVPYVPVKAGIAKSWDPGDGKAALQFFAVPDPLAYITAEIVRLRSQLKEGSFAVLVRSQQEAREVQQYLEERSLPCWTKSAASLGESMALRAFEELFDAIYYPRKTQYVKSFLTGPFVGWPIEAAAESNAPLPELFDWKDLLEKEGLAPFFRAFLFSKLGGEETVLEKIRRAGIAFYSDVFQIIEQLLQNQASHLEAIKRAFREWEAADPQENAESKRRIETDAEAIQIMTIHASKGLEFDVVFALGVGTALKKRKEELEEGNAEMMRLLYVALTRAKLRLYVPYSEVKSKGSESCLDVFWNRQKIGGNPLDWLMAKNSQIGCDRTISLLQERQDVEKSLRPAPKAPRKSIRMGPIRRIYSYSMLARGDPSAILAPITSEEKNLHTLPRGSATGELLHRIYERLFAQGMERVVAEEVRLTDLADWQASLTEMVEKTLALPLLEGGFSLKKLDSLSRRAEVEFLYGVDPHFYKGFIDLVFLWQGKLYCLDWKSNWVGDCDEAYSEENLCKAMNEGDYWLQASIYAAALQRAFPNVPFGGAFYCFLRGVHHSKTGGLLRFNPKEFSGV